MVDEPRDKAEGPGRPLSACGAFKGSVSLPHIAERVTGTVPITGAGMSFMGDRWCHLQIVDVSVERNTNDFDDDCDIKLREDFIASCSP